MWKLILLFLGLLISFLDYCLLRFNGSLDQELSDQLQEEFLQNYSKKHPRSK